MSAASEATGDFALSSVWDFVRVDQGSARKIVAASLFAPLFSFRAHSHLREGDRVPGVVVNDVNGSRSRQDGLELHEELVVLAEKVLDELQHLGPAEDLLRVHVEALEEFGPGAAVAGCRGHDVPNLVEELALHSGVVNHGGRGVEGGVVGVARLRE
jgi:hypothetical protein